MQDYVILTDSASDMPADLVKEWGVIVIPLQYTINEQEYHDDPLNRTLSSEDFFAMMRQGHQAQTVQITMFRFKEIFEPILQSGKDLIYLGFSSKISGTYDSSVLASQELAEQYPERTLLTVDTKGACMGVALIVDQAVQQKQQGKTIHELYDWVQDLIPHVCHWFTVDDLVYLKRGGRVSSIEAMIGKTLNIKPILHVDNAGALIPVGKTRGRRQSLETLAQKTIDLCRDPERHTIYICHADALEDAQKVEQILKTHLPAQHIRLGMMGPVIGAHAGPGTIAIFSLGRER